MPERLDRFMARANAAYYAGHDPFADFVTAPEISQIFGELLGAWAASVWAALGRPDPVMLVELGPGRGTLMGDALRVLQAGAADFVGALRVHFVETSPRLAALLRARFPDCAIHARIEDVPPGSAIVLGNEFLDALPIRQFVRRGSAWRERHVDAAAFVEIATDEAPRHFPSDIEEGEIVAQSDVAGAVVGCLAGRVATGQAAVLLVDYGGERETGDTLQALRAARPADPLLDPGMADLTAHVDFAGLGAIAAAGGAMVHGPLAQGLFLTRLGLYQRARKLASRDPGIAAAANRLAQPERMGVLFKAMALMPPTASVPAGFETQP